MGVEVRPEPPTETGGHQRPQAPRRVPRGRRSIMLAGGALLALVVIAVGLGAVSGRLPLGGLGAATATATLGPTRTLYQADWSHGAGDWTLPDHWQVRNGALVNDGQGDTALPVPYTIRVPNYTITWHASVVEVQAEPGLTQGGAKFGLEGRPQAGVDPPLFAAQMFCPQPGAICRGQSTLGTQGADPNNGGDGRAGSKRTNDFAAFDFNSTTRERIYSISVRGGHSVDLCIDDSCLDSVTSLKPLTPVQPALTGRFVQMTITSFVITTP